MMESARWAEENMNEQRSRCQLRDGQDNRLKLIEVETFMFEVVVWAEL